MGQVCIQEHPLSRGHRCRVRPPMYPRACRGWRPPCLAQTWGKGHEGGVALELIQEIGVEAAWVLELGGVLVCRYKQRNQEGAMGGTCRGYLQTWQDCLSSIQDPI